MLFDNVDITIQSPQNKTYNVNSLTLNFTVETNNVYRPPVTYVLNKQKPVELEAPEVGSRPLTTSDGVLYTRWTLQGNSVLSNLTDGTYFLLLQRPGSPAEPLVYANVIFTIDTIAPSVQVLQLENKTDNSASIPLNYTVNELSTVCYSLDGQANVTISENTTLTSVPDGSHTLVAYATDSAGNVGTSEIVLFNVNALWWAPYTIAASAVVGVMAAVVCLKKHKREAQRI
jgi:hypothetical protein